jgi:hypothetical protein
MTMDELDRILGSEESLQPSSGLADEVMKAIRREAETPAPLKFPWIRFIPGVAGGVTLVVTGIILMILHGLPQGSGPGLEQLAQWLNHPAASTWGMVIGSLAFSYLAYKLPMALVKRST